MSHLKTVRVLCTSNSCRSQMGEAIPNHDLAGLVRSISAGTSPQPKVADGAKQTCLIFPRPVKRIHVAFHDPHGEPLESFIAVRDDIRARLVPAVRAALKLGGDANVSPI